MKINLLHTKVPIRKLISLYKENHGSSHSGQWYIDFAYYENDPFTGRLEFIGISEQGYVNEKELYRLLKPALIKERRPTKRDLREKEDKQ